MFFWQRGSSNLGRKTQSNETCGIFCRINSIKCNKTRVSSLRKWKMHFVWVREGKIDAGQELLNHKKTNNRQPPFGNCGMHYALCGWRACVNVWHWILKFIFCPSSVHVHSCINRRRRRHRDASLHVYLFLSLFWRIPCRRQTVCTLHSNSGICEAEKAHERRTNEQRETWNIYKSLQNSDQIQICRRLLFIVTTSRWLRESTESWNWFRFLFLSFGARDFITARSNGHDHHKCVCALAACRSFFVNYFIMNLLMCGILGCALLLCCVRPALTARVWLLTYLFLVDVDVERDWKTEWMCADSYSTRSARALARSKAFSFELLAGFGRRILCVYSCHVNRQFWRIINSVVAFKKHSTNETERTENGTNGTNGIETRNEINKSFISFDFSRFFDCYRSPLLPCCPLTRLF